MYAPQPRRAVSGAASLGLVGLLGAALLLGLRVTPTLAQGPHLLAIDLTPPPPPPEPERKPKPRKAEKEAAKGDPSPRNLRNRATPVVAPTPPVVLKPPPPVIVAPEADIGAAANTGAADVRGPGRGAGGIGNGLGGGGRGGDGDGRAVVGPRRIRGDLGYDDLPKGILMFGQEAAVQTQFTVLASGRVSNCRVVRSSSYAAIDTLACRLIEQRFRFRPARDVYGRAVDAEMIETHAWVENGRD